jgi:hypothetical protein
MSAIDCSQCSPLAEEKHFSSETFDQFRRFHECLILDFVQKGLLKIAFGDLQWSDCIECGLVCTKCGGKFQFSAETYHQSGGEWRPVVKFT